MAAKIPYINAKSSITVKRFQHLLYFKSITSDKIIREPQSLNSRKSTPKKCILIKFCKMTSFITTAILTVQQLYSCMHFSRRF